MKNMKQKDGKCSHFQEELFSLVMDAIAPWAFPDPMIRNDKNWRILDVSMNNDQARVCVMHVKRRDQYTALICCHGQPEVIAVSFSSGNLGVLNPYLDCGHKLEADLEGPGCWNVLSVTFCAEPGAQIIRYMRMGEITEVHVNKFGAFSIIDWNSNQPIEEFIGVKVNGEWKKPVVAAIPYTIDYVTSCWRKAVYRENGMASRWNRWITAAFVELCGSDRAILQKEMMNAFASEKNQTLSIAFKQERRKFLEREKRPLDDLLLSA